MLKEKKENLEVKRLKFACSKYQNKHVLQYFIFHEVFPREVKSAVLGCFEFIITYSFQRFQEKEIGKLGKLIL